MVIHIPLLYLIISFANAFTAENPPWRYPNMPAVHQVKSRFWGCPRHLAE